MLPELENRDPPTRSDQTWYETENLVFLDAIYSIVQNYYVDEALVGNLQLMGTALRELRRQGLIELVVLSDGYEVKTGRSSLFVTTSEDYTYSSFLSDSIRVSSLLAISRSQEEIPDSGKSRTKGSGLAVFVNALLKGLDAHSELLDKGAYGDLKEGTEGSFGGLGVVVGVKDNILTVIRALPGSPAQQVGIRRLDKIMTIDGVDTYGSSLEELVDVMRGEPGSRVVLEILRDGLHSPATIVLKREIINVNSVESKIISLEDASQSLYLQIESFTSKTVDEVKNALSEVQGSVNGIVLDLRSNPGGLLNQAVAVADLFLKKGRIVSTAGRRLEIESAVDDLIETSLPIVVLMNSESASASEILAGALQDNNRATVIGEPSFGKGSVQTVFELPGEQALKLTIARYFTPANKSIQGIGIQPDIWIQPVLNRNINSNLMGAYRFYRHFFNRHLSPPSNSAVWSQHRPILKGHYLVNEFPHPFQELESTDEALELAIRYLRIIDRKYPQKLPEGMQRASHWLSLSSPEISNYLRKNNRLAEEFLERELAINWSSTDFHSKAPMSQIGFNVRQNIFETFEGETVTIPWSVKNFGSDKISRLSVYGQILDARSASKEFLVGSLSAQSVRKGKLPLDINLSHLQSPITVVLGIALDGIELSQMRRSIVVNISPKPRPILVVTLNLVDGLGNEKENLRAGKAGYVELEIRNEGEGKAEDLSIVLTNLSGQQVSFESKKDTTILNLNANESRKVRFKIQAAKRLISQEVIFGVDITSRDLFVPLRTSFAISSEPNFTVSNNENLGH